MYRFVVFFFKQKTAYEMRISDWSSDVCSSDLRKARVDLDCLSVQGTGLVGGLAGAAAQLLACAQPELVSLHIVSTAPAEPPFLGPRQPIGRASWRERVCQYV